VEAPPPILQGVAPEAPKVETKKDAKPVRALEIIEAEVAQCTKCGLAETRTKTVFARGNPNAKLVFVGEAPGADTRAQCTSVADRGFVAAEYINRTCIRSAARSADREGSAARGSQRC
jgi:hypothetical protein